MCRIVQDSVGLCRIVQDSAGLCRVCFDFNAHDFVFVTECAVAQVEGLWLRFDGKEISLLATEKKIPVKPAVLAHVANTRHWDTFTSFDGAQIAELARCLGVHDLCKRHELRVVLKKIERAIFAATKEKENAPRQANESHHRKPVEDAKPKKRKRTRSLERDRVAVPESDDEDEDEDVDLDRHNKRRTRASAASQPERSNATESEHDDEGSE